MIGYSGNPYEEHDHSYYARERADVSFGRCVEHHADSFMIDCMEAEDAATVIADHDLCDGDLLRDLMVVGARAALHSLSPEQAVTELRRVLREAFEKIARVECGK